MTVVGGKLIAKGEGRGVVKKSFNYLKLPDFLTIDKVFHILRGDQTGGGHLLKSLSPDIKFLGQKAGTVKNSFGVYQAEIEYIDKLGNVKKKISTMFPDNFTEQQTIDSISQAYKRRSQDPIPGKNNLFLSKDDNGMEILIAINLQTQKIISAYPKL